MQKYYSFLLRLWEIDNPQSQAWLASLEDPHTRQIVSFNNLDMLFDYIRAQTRLRDDNPIIDASNDTELAKNEWSTVAKKT